MDPYKNDSLNEENTDDLKDNMAETKERQRTESEGSDWEARFILPSIDGSPPKILTINEVVHAVKNIENMTLAHEIALNPEFKLQPYEPPENSLEKRVKDIMHKVFWDLLREQLNQIPPCYDNAIQLLGDIKECFPQIIPMSNQKLLNYINEVLDSVVIRQQAEQGVLDFKSYANFIINIMAKTCAPIRDDAVQKIRQIDDVVDTFKAILETMALMKLDMANFLLNFSRNGLLANSVEYEKAKFKEYLELYKFGFPVTENWLKRNQTSTENGNISINENTIFNAYMELLEWQDLDIYPEIFTADKDRILLFSLNALKISICASIVAVLLTVPIISQRKTNKIELTRQVLILLQSIKSTKDIDGTLENIWLQAKKVINDYLTQEQQNVLNSENENNLKTQIMLISNKESPIRKLMWNRLKTYVRSSLSLKPGAQLPSPPPGYFDLQEELREFAIQFKRFIKYNYDVFGEYYNEILEKANRNSQSTTTEEKN